MTVSGAGRARQGDREYEIAGSVNPIHGMEPFEIEFTAGETTPSIAMCVNIDLHRLGLPMDVVRAALPNLPASQLYPFFQGHLSGLARAAAKVEDTPAAVMLGSATTELARAWVASSSRDDRLVREGLASVLGRRIDDYIRRNLTDHSLTANRIASGTQHLSAIPLRALRQTGAEPRAAHPARKTGVRAYSTRSHRFQRQIDSVRRVQLRVRSSAALHPPLSRCVRNDAAAVARDAQTKQPRVRLRL